LDFTRREVIWVTAVLLISLFLSSMALERKLNRTESWEDGTLAKNHQSLLEGTFTNHEQSRLLQFLIPEVFHRAFSVKISDAYKAQRFLFVFLTLFLFYLYSRKWFKNWVSLLCSVLFYLTLILTFKNHLQESASLLSVTALLSLWYLREKRHLFLAVTVFIGLMNNETMLFFICAFGFFEIFKEKVPLVEVMHKSLIYFSLPLICFLLIRYTFRNHPVLGGGVHFMDNFLMLGKLFMVYHIFWILAFLTPRKKPRFVKYSLLLVPLFILPNFVFGAIEETRQMLPLAFIIIPASLFSVEYMLSRNAKHKVSLLRTNE